MQPCPNCQHRNRPTACFCSQCRAPLLLQGKYRIVRLLGSGGYGAVYQAEQLHLGGVSCAVKELRTDPKATPQQVQQAAVQFQLEASLLAGLNHPSLPRVTDFFAEGSRYYLVMEYVEGETLEERLTRNVGPLPEGQVLAWLDELCDVLTYLHTRQPSPIIHRDVKPANIKIMPDGKLKLIDFGISKLLAQGTKDAARAVSPPYSPFEQYGKGVSTDARSDIYALGVTLYQLLTNRLPPDAPDRPNESVVPPRQLNPALSSNTEMAILKAMAVNQGDRFQSAVEMKQAFKALIPMVQLPRTMAATPAASASPQVAPVALPRSRLVPSRGGVTPPSSVPAPVSLPATVSVVYASWGRRAVAYLIDVMLLYLVYLLFTMMLTAELATSYSRSSSTDAFYTLWCCAWYLLVPTYFVLCHTVGGQTLGKKALGIRVVRIADGCPPGLGWSILRSLVHGVESFFALCMVGWIGFLWPLWDPQKQALHDKVAGTIVIRT